MYVSNPFLANFYTDGEVYDKIYTFACGYPLTLSNIS